MAKVSSDNYPEVLRKVYIACSHYSFIQEYIISTSLYLLKCHIVNAPWVFGGIWTIAQMFINAKTIAKVNVLGSDFLVIENKLPDI